MWPFGDLYWMLQLTSEESLVWLTGTISILVSILNSAYGSLALFLTSESFTLCVQVLVFSKIPREILWRFLKLFSAWLPSLHNSSLLLLATSESLNSAVFSLTPSSCSTIQNVPPSIGKLRWSYELVYWFPFSWGPVSYTFCCPTSKKNVYLFHRLFHALYMKK